MITATFNPRNQTYLVSDGQGTNITVDAYTWDKDKEVQKYIKKNIIAQTARNKKEAALEEMFYKPINKKRRVTDRDYKALTFGENYWKQIFVEKDEKGERFDKNMLGLDYIDYFIKNLREAHPDFSFIILQDIIKKRLPFFKIDGTVLKAISLAGYSLVPASSARSELNRRKGIRKYRHFKGIENW